MIKLLRVDHRLLHGQVAFSWTQGLGADCILIANDDVPKNDIRKTTIKLAKPAGDEEKMVKELVANGCEVEIRQVPNDKKVAALNVL